VTEGNPGSNIDNSLAGVDFLYRNSRLAGNKVVELNAWLQESDTEGVAEDQDAYGFRVSAPNNTGMSGYAGYTRLGEGFDPGLGFLNRPGIQSLDLGTQYTHRPREGRLRAISSGIDAERIELLNGKLQSQEVRYTLIELENRWGDGLEIDYSAEQEQLDEPFEIWENIVLPMGHYSFEAPSIGFETADQRKVWGGLEYQNGEFYDGDREEISGEINWRPSGRLRTSLGYEYNDIDLPEGSFIARLAFFTTDVAFSSRLSWVTRIQYDNASELIGINMRLHWIPEAGREAYLVLNHNLEDSPTDLDDRYHSSTSEAVAKFAYTFRF
jgi:hypothetical protein